MSEKDVTPRNNIRPRTIILIVIAVAILGMVGSSFYVVDQTEQAVMLRFGKYISTDGPGLHSKIPFGIDKNYNVATTVVQQLSFGYRTERAGINTVYSSRDYPEESVMLTGDLNIVDVEWVIQYLITDPRAWLFNVDDKQQTIRDISQSVINQLVGDRSIFDVIGAERSNIQVQGELMMNEILKSYGLGVDITQVKLQNIVPPQGEVQDAFEDVNKAIQDMERLINEGKESYNTEIPRVRGEANQVIEVANGYASERVNQARGDVARYTSVLEEYNRSPEITKTRLYYEMMEEIFSNSENGDLIDRNLSNFIPLMSLQSEGVQ